MSRLLAVIGILIAGLAPAFGRSATEAEIAALEQRINAFDTAMQAGDFATIITVVPPPVLKRIADDTQIPVDQLETVLAEQMAEVLETVTLVSFGMDLDSAEHRELADGTPYILLPTETVLEADALGKMKVESLTLAMLDAGEWYLVRTSDAAIMDLLRQVYPQFTGVEFPADKTIPLEE